MNAIPSDLGVAARRASEQLTGYSHDVAVGAAGGGPASHATMANAARAAIFADALLGALHARLEEMKTVAK